MMIEEKTMMQHFKYLLVLLTTMLMTACSGVNKTEAISNGSTVVIAGKEWMRCSLGQTWEGNTCVGDAKKYTFDEAKTAAEAHNTKGYGGKRDWRVPTVRE